APAIAAQISTAHNGTTNAVFSDTTAASQPIADGPARLARYPIPTTCESVRPEAPPLFPAAVNTWGTPPAIPSPAIAHPSNVSGTAGDAMTSTSPVAAPRHPHRITRTGPTRAASRATEKR